MSALLVLLPLLGVVLLNLAPLRLANRVALPLAGLLLATEGVLVVALRGELAAELPVLSELTGAVLVDNLALVMFLSIAIVGLSAMAVAQLMLEDAETRFRFGNLLLLAVAGMNGLVLASDLFTLYVFLEVTAVSSFVLIAIERGRRALEGAFKYLVLSAVATTLLLGGLALLMVAAGGTGFADVRTVLQAGAVHSGLGKAAVAMFLAGLAVKAGLVPFHGWLPDAYQAAPAPVSVLLAGVVTKASGVYTLIRLCTAVFGFGERVQTVLMVAGTITLVVGAVAALGQKDFKRMLAYSSISQVGYIILGLGAGSTLGIAGAIFHLFNHSIFKTLLFVNAAAVEREARTTEMDRLGGIANKMPITGVTSVIAMLSTAGIPPLSGFWSKLIIVIAVWKAGVPAYAAIAVIASLVTLAYFLSMQRRVFFGTLAESCANLRETGLWGVAPALLLAGLTLALGLAAPWLFDTFLLPVGSIL